jgi:uncharacterized phage protein gp47/JayE
MALPIDQLIKPLTKEQVKASIYALLTAMGLPVTSWQEGGVARTIVAIVAVIFAGFTQLMALAIRSQFLDLAEGIWLTLLANRVYGVDRLEATYATTTLTIDNAAGGLYSFEPDELIIFNSATKARFTNAAAVTINPLATGVEVAIRALEAGTGSTSAPGTIDSFETVYLGLTCTNATSAVGLNGESDPLLRERCRDSLGARSPNGPKAAYRYWAKTAKRANGTPVGVTRVRLPTPTGDGGLSVIVAGASGAISGDANDPLTDLGAVAKSIWDNAVPEGIGVVSVASASNLVVAVTATVYVDSAANLSNDDVSSMASVALQDYFPATPIAGFIISPATGKIFRNALVGQIEKADKAIIKADVTLPASDVFVLGHQNTVLGAVTINVVQVTVEGA